MKCTCAILIETMRREGYEFQVSPPRVLVCSVIDGVKCEPVERLVVRRALRTVWAAVIDQLSISARVNYRI